MSLRKAYTFSIFMGSGRRIDSWWKCVNSSQAWHWHQATSWRVAFWTKAIWCIFFLLRIDGFEWKKKQITVFGIITPARLHCVFMHRQQQIPIPNAINALLHSNPYRPCYLNSRCQVHGVLDKPMTMPTVKLSTTPEPTKICHFSLQMPSCLSSQVMLPSGKKNPIIMPRMSTSSTVAMLLPSSSNALAAAALGPSPALLSIHASSSPRIVSGEGSESGANRSL